MFGEVSIEDQAMNASNLTFGDDRLGVMFYAVSYTHLTLPTICSV